MIDFKLESDHIPLISLLKALQMVENGGEAQAVVSAGLVKCNGEIEMRKRFKLRVGHVVEFDGEIIRII